MDVKGQVSLWPITSTWFSLPLPWSQKKPASVLGCVGGRQNNLKMFTYNDER